MEEGTQALSTVIAIERLEIEMTVQGVVAGVESAPTPAGFQETVEATTLNASMTSPASADLSKRSLFR